MAVVHNRRVFDDFVGQLRNRFEELAAHEVDPGRYLDKRKNSPRNKLFETVPLADAYEQLLAAV